MSKPKPQKPPEPPEAVKTGAILDSISDGVFTVDLEWRVTSFNRAAERITGVRREEALGRPCCEVFRASICESRCALRSTIETGRPVVGRSVTILAADGREVPISISTALLRDGSGKVVGGAETFRDMSAIEELRRELRGEQGLLDMVAHSHRMKELLAVLPRIAESGSTCLVEGESGTGKELVARALHELSARRKKPFVAVNCAALPDALLESELFGHKAGAFTDARSDRQGRFAAAEGGTVFLDEAGDVSPAMQARLLRVLQEREYEPLGSSKTVKTDVRVVAATNRNLDELVAAGRFRQDLYYRIAVVRVRVPPLRERMEDVPPLVEHFVRKLNLRTGRDVAGVDRQALALLMRHDWPGNVRELENAVEHAFALAPGALIGPEHLPEKLRGTMAVPSSEFRVSSSEPGTRNSEPGTTLEEVEAQAIRRALERHGGRKADAARELGIDPSTLWRKMRRAERGKDHP